MSEISDILVKLYEKRYAQSKEKFKQLGIIIENKNAQNIKSIKASVLGITDLKGTILLDDYNEEIFKSINDQTNKKINNFLNFSVVLNNQSINPYADKNNNINSEQEKKETNNNNKQEENNRQKNGNNNNFLPKQSMMWGDIGISCIGPKESTMG